MGRGRLMSLNSTVDHLKEVLAVPIKIEDLP